MGIEEKCCRDMQNIEMILRDKNLKPDAYVPAYGDLSQLNTDGLILSMVGRDRLMEIVSEYLDLLETSAAIYERNGDYALGIASSEWCRLMDTASRNLCETDDNQEALACGKWLCHESCWKDASLQAIQLNRPVEIECSGGINIYAVPVKAGDDVVGAINFGFGSPPVDENKLEELAGKFRIPVSDLRPRAAEYVARPDFVINYARRRLHKSAAFLGQIIEIKQIEKELERSKKNWEAVFNGLTHPTVILDSKHNVLEINDSLRKKLEKDSRDIRILKCWQIFHNPNASGPPPGCPFEKMLKTGVAETVEMEVEAFGGYCIVSCTPLLDDEGKLERIVHIGTDITDRKRAEIALKESHRRYRELFEGSRDGFVVVDHQGGFQDANSAFCDMLGYTLDELKSLSNFYTITPKRWHHWEETEIWKNRLLKNGVSGVYEKEYIRKDGTIFPVELQSFTVLDENGTLQYLWGIARDISERKQALKVLRDSEEKFRFITDNSLDAIWQMDLKLKFTYICPSVNTMLGFTQDEWIGSSLSEHCTRKEFFNMARKALWGLKNYLSFKSVLFEAVMLRKDGSSIPVEILGKLILNQKGLPVGFQGSTRDITDRKKVEHELRKLKNDLEIQVAEKTRELKNRVADLERFHDATISREYRIKELKDEIDRLKKKNG